MKTNKFIILLLAFIVSISFNSCVEDGDYTVPQNLGAEENAKLNTLLADNAIEIKTVAQVNALYVSGNTPTEITDKLVVKGYVTSSDRSGNFFKEFFIQDAPENPTAAIKVVLELTDTYNKFNIGREVYINLEGLFIGEVRSGDEVTAIGGKANSDGEIENLSLNQIEKSILRSSKTEELVPLNLSFSQINESKVGMFVQVDNAQFPEDIAGKGNFYDNTDRFDTQRTLESCQGFGFSNFILETSAFSSFGSRTLPTGGGSIKAVVSKTFDGRNVILALNDVNDVDMTGDRCTLLNIDDFTTIFSEDFDDLTTNWTSVSVSGSQTWGLTTFGNPGSAARVSGFSNGAQANEDWLISKVQNITGASNAFLIFETVKRFDGTDLELFYATDYTGGNPNEDGTWVSLSPTLDTNVSSWSSWTSSGALDLTPTIDKDLFIAFKYTSDSNAAATFQIDNLKILTK